MRPWGFDPARPLSGPLGNLLPSLSCWESLGNRSWMMMSEEGNEEVEAVGVVTSYKTPLQSPLLPQHFYLQRSCSLDPGLGMSRFSGGGADILMWRRMCEVRRSEWPGHVQVAGGKGQGHRMLERRPERCAGSTLWWLELVLLPTRLWATFCTTPTRSALCQESWLRIRGWAIHPASQVAKDWMQLEFGVWAFPGQSPHSGLSSWDVREEGTLVGAGGTECQARARIHHLKPTPCSGEKTLMGVVKGWVWGPESWAVGGSLSLPGSGFRSGPLWVWSSCIALSLPLSVSSHFPLFAFCFSIPPLSSLLHLFLLFLPSSVSVCLLPSPPFSLLSVSLWLLPLSFSLCSFSLWAQSLVNTLSWGHGWATLFHQAHPSAALGAALPISGLSLWVCCFLPPCLSISPLFRGWGTGESPREEWMPPLNSTDCNQPGPGDRSWFQRTLCDPFSSSCLWVLASSPV